MRGELEYWTEQARGSVRPLPVDFESGANSKESMRRVPNRGLGFTLLRYLARDQGVLSMMGALPEPQVGFNNLGQFKDARRDDSLLKRVGESGRAAYDPQGRHPYVFDVFASEVGRRLSVNFMYSENIHRRETVERVARSFRRWLGALIEATPPRDAHES